MMFLQEQVGLSDATADHGISAERNRTWYISYKQQVRAVCAGPAHELRCGGQHTP